LKNISSNTRASAAKPALPHRKSLSVTKSYSFNHMIIANQCAVGLFAGVLAEAIARVYSKLDQPPVNMLTVLSQVGRLGVTLPFDLSAVGIEQHSLHPIPNNLFVILGKWSAKGRIHILREGAESKKAD
jgi:hypothetical protein